MGGARRRNAARYTAAVPDARPLCSRFLGAFESPPAGATDALERLLSSAIEAATLGAAPRGTAYGVGPEDIASALGGRIRSAAVEDVAEKLSALHVADLVLATALAQGHGTALRAFEQEFLGEGLARRLAGLRLSATELDEVKQRLRVELLVPRDDRPPRIAEYEGTGPLGAWIRVSATRIALKLRRGKANQSNDDEDALLAQRASGDDPELVHFKRVYSAAFKVSFEEALPKLTEKERLLLRQNVLDGLGIDELGALYGVHRSTVARWIDSARESLLAETKKRFMAKAKVDPKNLESVLRLVESQLDVSLRRVL